MKFYIILAAIYVVSTLRPVLAQQDNKSFDLPKETFVKYVADTKLRFDSIKKIPEDVREAFFDSLDRSKNMDGSSLSLEDRAEYKRMCAEDARSIADRNDPWTYGCTSGRHFLDAGKTETDWWIFYESGGIVNSGMATLAILRRHDGKTTVSASHEVKRR